MKLIQALAATALVLAFVGTSIAQEVLYPGNGVSQPVVVTEVHPSAERATTVALQCVVRPNGTASDIEVAFSPDARSSQWDQESGGVRWLGYLPVVLACGVSL